VSGDGEDARAGAHVQNRDAAKIELLQRCQAQTRRRVMAGSESHRRLDDDHLAVPAPSIGGRCLIA